MYVCMYVCMSVCMCVCMCVCVFVAGLCRSAVPTPECHVAARPRSPSLPRLVSVAGSACRMWRTAASAVRSRVRNTAWRHDASVVPLTVLRKCAGRRVCALSCGASLGAAEGVVVVAIDHETSFTVPKPMFLQRESAMLHAWQSLRGAPSFRMLALLHFGWH